MTRGGRVGKPLGKPPNLADELCEQPLNRRSSIAFKDMLWSLISPESDTREYATHVGVQPRALDVMSNTHLPHTIGWHSTLHTEEPSFPERRNMISKLNLAA